MKPVKYLRPGINRKVIRFFLENPSSIDTPRGIATWINEKRGETEAALRELAKAGVLITHGAGSASAYGYTNDRRLAAKVRKSMRRKKPRKK